MIARLSEFQLLADKFLFVSNDDMAFKQDHINKVTHLYLNSMDPEENVIESDITLCAMSFLAYYQFEQGKTCDDLQQKFSWHQKAAECREYLANTYADQLMADDWRDLAIYQNTAGETCNHPQQTITYYKKAIKSWAKIKKEDLIVEDWRDLAIYEKNLAAVYCDCFIEDNSNHLARIKSQYHLHSSMSAWEQFRRGFIQSKSDIVNNLQFLNELTTIGIITDLEVSKIPDSPKQNHRLFSVKKTPGLFFTVDMPAVSTQDEAVGCVECNEAQPALSN